MSRAVYEVVPASAGGWIVRMAGDSVSELVSSREDAVRRARTLGANYDEWTVRVLSEGGAVERELRSSDQGSV